MKFIELTDPTGDMCAINPQQVLIVRPLSFNNLTRIVFTNGSKVEVAESFQEVLLKVNMQGGD